jgi:hypothetical protein
MPGQLGRGRLEAADGKRYFDEADALFRAGRYVEALSALRALDDAYPGTKNILFPMALCLEHLGRGDEAQPICDVLIDKFQHAQAIEMKLRLRPTTLDVSLDSLEIEGDYDVPDLGPVETLPVPELEEERTSPWKVVAVVGGCLVSLLIVLCTPFILQKLGVVETRQETAVSSPLAMMNFGIVLIGLMLFQAFGTGVAALALGTINKLPANSISGVLLHVGMTLLGANIISVILILLLTAIAPLYLGLTVYIVEHIVMLAVFSYVYRFSITDAMVFFGFFFILITVAMFVAGFTLGTGLGMATFFFTPAITMGSVF